MKYVVAALALSLPIFAARAELPTPQCSLPWWVPMDDVPTLLFEAPPVPYIFLPLVGPVGADRDALPVNALTVRVLDPAEKPVDGVVDTAPISEHDPYNMHFLLRWHPIAPLAEGAYRIEIEVAAPSGNYGYGYCDYKAFSRRLDFTVVSLPPPPPQLEFVVHTEYRAYWSAMHYGLCSELSDGLPCEEFPYACCTHQFDANWLVLASSTLATTTNALEPFYTKLVVEIEDPNGLRAPVTSEYFQVPPSDGGLFGEIFDVPDEGPPPPNTACVRMRLYDFLRDETPVDLRHCADPASHVVNETPPREPCNWDLCRGVRDPNALPDPDPVIADPDGQDAIADSDPMGALEDGSTPHRTEADAEGVPTSDGCAADGGVSSQPGVFFALACLVWRRPRPAGRVASRPDLAPATLPWPCTTCRPRCGADLSQGTACRLGAPPIDLDAPPIDLDAPPIGLGAPPIGVGAPRITPSMHPPIGLGAPRIRLDAPAKGFDAHSASSNSSSSRRLAEVRLKCGVKGAALRAAPFTASGVLAADYGLAAALSATPSLSDHLLDAGPDNKRLDLTRAGPGGP